MMPHPTLVPTTIENNLGRGRQEPEAAEEQESLKGEKQLGRNNQNARRSEEQRVWPSGDGWTWMI